MRFELVKSDKQSTDYTSKTLYHCTTWDENNVKGGIIKFEAELLGEISSICVKVGFSLKWHSLSHIAFPKSVFVRTIHVIR